MYNTSTKSYTLEDAGGSYSWIFENIDRDDCKHMTDDDIYAWVDQLIDTEAGYDEQRIEDNPPTRYPAYGHSTADLFETADDWIAWKKQELQNDMKAERAYVFALIKDWIATGNTD